MVAQNELIFEDFGGDFTEAFLEDFARNPMDPKFGLLRFMLPGILEKARQKTGEVSGAIATAQNSL